MTIKQNIKCSNVMMAFIPIMLTAMIAVNKEFELLLFLAENPNIVFSKDMLFDRAGYRFSMRRGLH